MDGNIFFCKSLNFVVHLDGNLTIVIHADTGLFKYSKVMRVVSGERFAHRHGEADKFWCADSNTNRRSVTCLKIWFYITPMLSRLGKNLNPQFCCSLSLWKHSHSLLQCEHGPTVCTLLVGYRLQGEEGGGLQACGIVPDCCKTENH